MSWDRDRTVALVGGLALVLVVAAWATVEARTGPFEHALAPADGEAVLAGTVTRQPATGPGGVGGACQGPTGEAVCQPPRTRIELSATGLPDLGGAGAYAAVATGEDRRVALGTLEPDEDAHQLVFDEPVDGQGLDRLVVSLVADPAGSDSARFELAEVVLPASQGGPIRFSDTVPVALGSVTGEVAVAQIGLVEVSTTVAVEASGLPSGDGWIHHAWLVDEDTGEVTPLGALDGAPEGTGRLDVRVGRVTLAEQDRFVVTLAPGPVQGDRVAGFPVVDVEL